MLDKPSPNEKGDVLLLEKSVDPGDIDTIYSEMATHSASNGDGIVLTNAYSQAQKKEVLGFLHAQELAGSSKNFLMSLLLLVPRELFASRSDIDNRYDGGYTHTRGSYNS